MCCNFQQYATGLAEQALEAHSDRVSSVVFSPDDTKLASASKDKTMQVWNVATGLAGRTLEGHSYSVTSMAFSPDGTKLASASSDRTVRVWNVASGQVEQMFKVPSAPVNPTYLKPVISMAFSFNGTKLASSI